MNLNMNLEREIDDLNRSMPPRIWDLSVPRETFDRFLKVGLGEYAWNYQTTIKYPSYEKHMEQERKGWASIGKAQYLRKAGIL